MRTGIWIPRNPMEGLDEFGGSPLIPTSEGGGDRISRTSWLARVAIPVSSGFRQRDPASLNKVEESYCGQFLDMNLGSPYICIHTHTHECTHTHTHTYACTHTHTHTHMHVPTHTHMHVHTHACTHTHTHLLFIRFDLVILSFA